MSHNGKTRLENRGFSAPGPPAVPSQLPAAAVVSSRTGCCFYQHTGFYILLSGCGVHVCVCTCVGVPLMHLTASESRSVAGARLRGGNLLFPWLASASTCQFYSRCSLHPFYQPIVPRRTLASLPGPVRWGGHLVTSSGLAIERGVDNPQLWSRALPVLFSLPTDPLCASAILLLGN